MQLFDCHSDDSVQVAILAGDFLLARASVSLAALRNSDVMQLFSQVIEDLVSGEIMQVRLLLLAIKCMTIGQL